MRYERFEVTVGVADYKKHDPHTPLTFEVYGDGKQLWKSKPVKRCGEPQHCKSVNVKTVKQLELRVECPGDAGYAVAVWYEPRFYDQ